MPTDKRQRQKQARSARQEELRAARIRAARRRSTIRIVVIMVVVVGLLSLFGVFKGDDKTKVNSGDKSGPAAPYGSTACPPTDGSERKTSFPAPFKKCIDIKKTYVASMKTDVGDIEIKLDPSKAPATVNNFVALARYRFYDGVPFYRVIPGFVVQGGADKDRDGTVDAGYRFTDELPDPKDYKSGSLAMANSGPDTNGSSFFVLASDEAAQELVQAGNGNANYSLFGQVTKGMDVVKKIEADGTAGGTPSKVHKIITLTIKETS